MKRLIWVGALALLAACGADGDPVRPSVDLGVSIGPDGVRTTTGVSVRKGPVTVGVQL